LQLLDSYQEKKSKKRGLEILVSKIVSFLRSCSNQEIHVPPERLALKWVQKYITEFGGDPQKVTL
jgi:hypothetical protein